MISSGNKWNLSICFSLADWDISNHLFSFHIFSVRKEKGLKRDFFPKIQDMYFRVEGLGKGGSFIYKHLSTKT